MASFVRAPAPRAEWTVEDAARFAALKEFKLLQQLSSDKQALTMARRDSASFSDRPDAAAHAATATCSSCGCRCRCAAGSCC